MALSSFVLAKVAATPLMFFYAFIGASTGALLGSDASATSEQMKEIEENETLIVSGIVLSFVMIAGITHSIRKELNKVRCFVGRWLGSNLRWSLLTDFSLFHLCSLLPDSGSTRKVQTGRKCCGIR